MHTIEKEMMFTNIRRNEADGMNHTIRITFNKNDNPLLISTPSEDSLGKWMKAFKKL
jgi:hypothetical protein